MALYTRTDSPYYWKRYEKDPRTGIAPKSRSTRIHVDAPTKEQRAQNLRDAEYQYSQDVVHQRQGIILPTSKPRPYVTFQRWIADFYRQEVTMHHRGAQKELPKLDRLVREFGPLTLEEFTVKRVNAYRRERQRTVKISTANRELFMLIAILKRWAETLRAEGCDAPAPDEILSGIVHPDEEETETRYFTHDEFARFIAAVNAHDVIQHTPRLEGLALASMAVETLLRLSSLLKLQWAHYRGTHFRPLDAKVEIKRSPISSNLRGYLHALPKTTDRIFASHHRAALRATRRGIFMSEEKRALAAAHHAQQWFYAVCRLAELPVGREQHGLTFHAFRHTGATWYLNGSATRRPRSVKTVMDMGGWKNIKTFIGTYCHTNEQEQDEAAESMFPTGLPGVHRPTLVQTAESTD
jgi:integrase